MLLGNWVIEGDDEFRERLKFFLWFRRGKKGLTMENSYHPRDFHDQPVFSKPELELLIPIGLRRVWPDPGFPESCCRLFDNDSPRAGLRDREWTQMGVLEMLEFAAEELETIREKACVT